jgi:type II secretion system protein G
MDLYKNKKSVRGFTLIELLIVIAIIGILASIVLVSLSQARAKAKDARMAANIKSVQTALDTYYIDNGYYVSSPDAVLDTALTAALVPTYIRTIPLSESSWGPFRYYNAGQNPAAFYAIRIPYETKPDCYVCGGTPCWNGIGWWGLSMCQ